MFKNLWNQIPAWLMPSRIFATLSNVLDLWKSADTKNRGILIVVFFPMLLCLGGMAFSLISFGLFVLPSFVVRMFMWGALVMLFNFVGNYGYSHLTGQSTSTSSGTNWWAGMGGGKSNANSSTSNTSDNNFEYTDVSFTEDSTGTTGNTQSSYQSNAQSQSREKTAAQKWFERVRGKGRS